jgi:hypothetical protein
MASYRLSSGNIPHILSYFHCLEKSALQGGENHKKDMYGII